MTVQVPDVPELDLFELLNYEKETTGLYLSGHPMDKYRKLLQSSAAVSTVRITGEEADCPDGSTVTVCGIVQSLSTKTTRNNSLMAYVTLEDDAGSVEALVFSTVLNQYEKLLTPGSAVALEGRVSVRDEKAAQLIVNRVFELEAYAALSKQARRTLGRPSGCARLYLKLPSEQDPRYPKVRAILNMFPGPVQAVLYFADTGLRRGALCTPEAVMLDELRSLLGEDAVAEK